jgi:hypothetical protein
MQLDQAGLWPEINDSDYQPEPNFAYPEGAGPTYGDIPAGLWVSDEIRKTVDYPLPGEDVTIVEEDKEAAEIMPNAPSGDKPD